MESEFDKPRQQVNRRSPKDIKLGRTFGKLSRYDLLLDARICCQDVEPIYRMSDSEFDIWIMTGVMT